MGNASQNTRNPIKICVAGADGRMGGTLVRDLKDHAGIQITGVLTASNSPNKEKKLGDLALSPPQLTLHGPDRLEDAVRDADVYVSFTAPQAELENIPRVVELRKKIVMGTTGLKEEERQKIEDHIRTRVPAVVSPNFSVGINLLTRLLKVCEALPEDYDFSVIEAHHTGKKDAPSGTARLLGDIIKQMRDYPDTVYGREGISPRRKSELEITSVRAGGIPGIHDIVIAGQHEMLKIEHTAFSRSVFAYGAITAVKWVSTMDKPGVYSMTDVLSSRARKA